LISCSQQAQIVGVFIVCVFDEELALVAIQVRSLLPAQ